MYNQILSFWQSIVSVFFPSGSQRHLSFSSFWVNYSSTYTLDINSQHFASLLAVGSLFGLSCFLFYQIYKVIHAFIGGFYEDAI